MSVDTAIQAALYAHLLKMNLPKPLPVAPEGKSFDGKGKAYLRPTYMPAEANAPHIPFDGEAEHVGLFQIDVFWPAGKGIAEPLAIADAVRAHFPRGLRFFLDGVDLRINREPSTLPAQQEEALLMIPVRIPWWACITPTA